MADGKKIDFAKYGKQVNFRVKPAEYELIEAKAEAAQMSVAEYARAVVLKGKTPKRIIDAEQGARILTALTRIGSNVNQIAKAANEAIQRGQQVDLGTVEELRVMVRSYERFVTTGKGLGGNGKEENEEGQQQPTGTAKRLGKGLDGISEPKPNQRGSLVSKDSKKVANDSKDKPRRPVCEVCGRGLIVRYRRNDHGAFWTCPKGSKQEKHTTMSYDESVFGSPEQWEKLD